MLNFVQNVILKPVYEIVASPLLGRELRVFLRSKKSFFAMLFFLLALLGVVSQNWAVFAAHWEPGQNLAHGARTLFFALSYGHLIFLMLVTPFLMAPLIAGEQEKSTITLMLSSPISVTHFILAKGLIPLVFVILLFTAAVPVLALCFLGGGLSAADLTRTYLILLSATLCYGSLGLYCSTLRPRVYEVYLITVLMVLIYGFILPYHGTIWHFLTTMRWEGVSYNNHGFHYLSHYYALIDENLAVTDPQYVQKTIPFPNIKVLWDASVPLTTRIPFGPVLHYLLSAFICVFFIRLSVLRVRKIALGEAHLVPVEEEEEELPEFHERDYDITFENTSDEGNPGLVLERRVQWFAKLTVLIRLFYISLMVSVIALPLSSYEGSWLFLSIPFMAAAFFTLPLAATSISSDHERQTLDLIRTSLLSSRQIIHAKFISNLQYSLVIAFALYAPGMLLQILCGWVFGYEVDLASSIADTVAIIWCPLLIVCALSIYTALGLYCSTLFRRTNRSMLIAGVVILLTLVTPFMLPDAGVNAIGQSSTWLLLGLAFLSPLSGVALVFPEGSINMPGISIMVRNFLHYLSGATIPESVTKGVVLEPATYVPFAPYIFASLQCIFCVLGASYLLKRSVAVLEKRD